VTAAGYSGTPLPRKLGIREGGAVAFLRAPDGFAAALGAAKAALDPAGILNPGVLIDPMPRGRPA
jgi:FAD/FMN-containing dehydrogenase